MFGSNNLFTGTNIGDTLRTISLVFIILLAVGLLSYFLLNKYLKNLKEEILKKKHLGLAFFEVKLPQSNEVEIKAAEQMFTGLIGIGQKLKGLKKF